MKLLCVVTLSAAIAGAGLCAEPTFPGLNKVLTEAEWKRAGLDKLTPDQIGVIDAALIRHVAQVITKITTPPPVTYMAAP